jgi:TRAP-type C4-dicarboxylate transport system permease small subunit
MTAPGPSQEAAGARSDQGAPAGEPTAGPASLLSRAIWLGARIEDALLVFLLGSMLLLALAQILLRNVLSTGLLWGDGALRVLVLWVGLLGALAATRDDRQITVDVLARLLPPRGRSGVRVVVDLFTAAVSGLVGWHSGRLVVDSYEVGTTAFAAVPDWICQLILPVAFGLIALRYLLYAIRHLNEALGRGAAS